MKSLKENYLMSVKGNITSNTQKFKKLASKEEIDFLKSKYPSFEPKESLKLYVKSIENKKCLICNKQLTMKQHLRKTDWCSNKCHTIHMHKNKTGIGSTKSLKKKLEGISKIDEEKKYEKYEKTCMEKYGCKNVSQAKMVREKIENHFEKKYGNKNILITDHFHKKMLEKYGVKNRNQIHIIDGRYEDLNNPDWLKEKHKEFSLEQISKILGVTKRTVELKFKKLNLEINDKKNNKRSKLEIEVQNFIEQECGLKTENSVRTILKNNKELDIYIPEKNIAIEFNGLYWHSCFDKNDEKNVSKRHIIKTDECEEKGIQLLHIFENEWINNKDLWKSVIKAKCGIFDRKYGARELKISINEDKIKIKNFLSENHLQGSSNFNFSICLINENKEIIQVATFGKPRFTKHENCLELLRFCTKKNNAVIGGFSKIIKNYKKNNKEDLLSYANRRWSDGGVYKRHNFDFLNFSKESPLIWNKNFSNPKKLEHRTSYQKHKLKNKLAIFYEDLSAHENLYLNNYGIIWDSGNIVFKLNNS